MLDEYEVGFLWSVFLKEKEGCRYHCIMFAVRMFDT